MLRTVLLLVMFSVPLAHSHAAEMKPQPSVLATANGRYVFGQVSNFRADKYLLDTKTGRLWTIVETTTKEGEGATTELLQPVPYMGTKGYALTPE